jgi:RNA-directed DNA polymerase
VDKVYKRKNLEMAWEHVKANRGSGGIDGQSIEEFEQQPSVRDAGRARASPPATAPQKETARCGAC